MRCALLLIAGCGALVGVAQPSNRSFTGPPCASADLPGECRTMVHRHRCVRGVRVEAPAFEVERYCSVITCGGATLMTCRADEDGWRDATVVRRLIVGAASANMSFSESRTVLPAALNMSHNAAFVCTDGRLTAFGGQRKTILADCATRTGDDDDPPPEPICNRDVGIQSRSARRSHADGSVVWGQASTVISGSMADGCHELRHTFLQLHPGVCEFDGKLSVVRWKGGLLLFARANLHHTGGFRHVQVARSSDGGRTWGPFSLVAFDGYNYTSAAECDAHNIYYFEVHADGDRLIAVYPGTVGGGHGCAHGGHAEGTGERSHHGNAVGRHGLFISASADGYHWSEPERLLESKLQFEGRTADHPAGMLRLPSEGQNSSVLRLLVVHNVYGIVDAELSARGYTHTHPLMRSLEKPLLCAYDLPPHDLVRARASAHEARPRELPRGPPYSTMYVTLADR